MSTARSRPAFGAFRAPEWRRLSASARGALLRRFGDIVAREADRLAELETRDNGKLIAEMRAQLRYLPQWFHYFGGLADKLEGRVIPIDKPGVFNFTREEPLGVVAAITPWNSPLLLAAWKLAPALAAGNTAVWKPSEFSSVSALEFGHLFEEAGFPPGVVNIVTGFGSEIGDALVTHPKVAKVATGGDKTGAVVYESAARSIKPVTLELGGKSANIVFGTRSSMMRSRAWSRASSPRPADLHRRLARPDPPRDRRRVHRAPARPRAHRQNGRPPRRRHPGRSDHDAPAVQEGA